MLEMYFYGGNGPYGGNRYYGGNNGYYGGRNNGYYDSDSDDDRNLGGRPRKAYVFRFETRV